MPASSTHRSAARPASQQRNRHRRTGLQHRALQLSFRRSDQDHRYGLCFRAACSPIPKATSTWPILSTAAWSVFRRPLPLAANASAGIRRPGAGQTSLTGTPITDPSAVICSRLMARIYRHQRTDGVRCCRQSRPLYSLFERPNTFNAQRTMARPPPRYSASRIL